MLQSEDSLYWLLKEPVVCVKCCKSLCGPGPSVMKKFVSSEVLTLGNVVELCGSKLENIGALTSRLGIISTRPLGKQLGVWKEQLKLTEQNLLTAPRYLVLFFYRGSLSTFILGYCSEQNKRFC